MPLSFLLADIICILVTDVKVISEHCIFQRGADHNVSRGPDSLGLKILFIIMLVNTLVSLLPDQGF